MLRFSEGPRGRAISASSIPVAECQVAFVSPSFARDTYRPSKTGRMNRDERKTPNGTPSREEDRDDVQRVDVRVRRTEIERETNRSSA